MITNAENPPQESNIIVYRIGLSCWDCQTNFLCSRRMPFIAYEVNTVKLNCRNSVAAHAHSIARFM